MQITFIPRFEMLLGCGVRHLSLLQSPKRTRPQLPKRRIKPLAKQKYNLQKVLLTMFFCSAFQRPAKAKGPDKTRVQRLPFLPRRSSPATAASKTETVSTTWSGAKLKPLAICLAAGFAIRFLVPIPQGITPEVCCLSLVVNSIHSRRGLCCLSFCARLRA